jgi:site-specific recombinase XerD
MKLYQLISTYTAYRKALGEKFKTNETYLNAFSKSLGTETPVNSISKEMVNNFLYGGSKTVTSGWFVKYSALKGLFHYALTREYILEIPLPAIIPKRPSGLIPYIYSQEELKQLFETALTYQKNKSKIDPFMVRMVFLLTYTLGLRIHETLSVKLGDINVKESVVTINDSKFYKSRQVPFNLQLKKELETFFQWRIQHHQSQDADAYLFLCKEHKPLNIYTINDVFQRIRKKAGVKREDGATYQPRIHDLRHTFAVNRLTTWYKENKDVHQLLPILSIYLGHKYMAHTSVYLSMTDNLLLEANNRFEKYARGNNYE